MATLSGASGTPTSITLTVSGMSSTTKYKRKYEYILAGQVMATVTDSTAGTTTAHRVITGLTPDTLYICRVRIYNSSTGALVAETNSISVRTLAQSTSQATVSILNFLDNLTQLASGSFKGDIGDTFYISAAGTQYQTYSQQYHFLYFRLSSQNYSTEHDASYPIPIQEGQTVKVYYQSKTTTIPIYNYLDGQHTLSDGSVSGTIGNSFFLSMSGTQYQTYSQEYEFQYFRLASEGYATNHAATETIPITSGQAVRVYYKTKITAFAWTSDDASYIAAGKAVTYLTAASWNRLTAKINEVRTARGYSSISFTTAYAGQTITAAIYNEAANAIGNLAGAGSVSTVSAGTKLEATYFANSYSALKEALNRAISSYNG